MKLEYASKNVLAATKSKAKLHEFGIEEKFHKELFINPKNLLILSIGILGDLAALEQRSSYLKESHSENYIELKSQLILVAQYFDSFDHTKIDQEMSAYLKMVGASAYYLADMPGSASVLAKSLQHIDYGLTPNSVEGPLIWILKASKKEKTMYYSKYTLINNIIFDFVKFTNQEINSDQILESCKLAQKFIYENGNDRELFFADIIIAIVRKRVRNSSIICLPLYTEMDLSKWNSALKKEDFINEFWPAQRLLGEKNIFLGKSGVVQMPTSAGKTKSTELIIRSAFLSGRANLAVIVAPFRALCREISDSFASAFANENISINSITDTPKIDDQDLEFIKFLMGSKFKDPNEHKTVLVSTPEKLVYLLRHRPEIANKIGLLVFDEGHQFDNGLRGVTYELLVASLKKSVLPETQIVLISAVIGNAKSIGDWLYGEKGIDILGSHCIPNVRSTAFASWTDTDGQLNYIDSEEISEREFIVPGVISQVNLGKIGKQKKDRFFPDRTKAMSIPGYLGVKLCHQGSVAIFCGTKVLANSVCKSIVEAYGQGLEMPSPLNNSDTEEIKKISYLSELHFGKNDLITKSISLGVLPHSRNIPNGLRISIEWAMANESACLVVCTSTLSQGVNLPIKYLIVSGTNQSNKEIRKRDFHNLMGRAGRSGYHTEGSIIFSDTKLFEERYTGGKWKWDKTLKLLDTNDGDICVSTLKELISPCPTILFSWDVIKLIEYPDAVRNEISKFMGGDAEHVSSLSSFADKIEEIIQKIESFMLSYYKDNPDSTNIEALTSLAKDTLAHHLSSDFEKEMLIKCFEKIATNVLSVEKTKISYYGKALLGIKQLERIENWAIEKDFELALCEKPSDLLTECWTLITEIITTGLIKKIHPEESLLKVAQAWIAGDSYTELLKIFSSHDAFSQAEVNQMKIQMPHVVEFTDGVLGYDGMLIIGALADIIEGNSKNEKIATMLRSLQESLKIGLGSNFEKWIFNKGYADREVSKFIAKSYSMNGISWEVPDYKILERESHILNTSISNFPSYFSAVGF